MQRTKTLAGLLLIPIILLLAYMELTANLGMRQSAAVGHILTSVAASVLIIYLAIQFRLKQRKFHKEVAYLMAFLGILSLYFAWQYGFAIQVSFNAISMHNIFGFVSLALSLIPVAIKPGGKHRLHCRIATAAAIFAVLSIVTGIIGYQHLILNVFGMR